MGRKCCSKKISCNPCCPPYFNPCCPPYFGPCCPPPCAAFCCPPCCDDFSHSSNCGCDSCSNKGKSSFSASSSNTVDLSGQASPYVIIFDEQQDCLCEYANNTTFIPKCKGYYNFKVNVTVNQSGSLTQTVTVALVVNGTTKATSIFEFTTSGQTKTFTINQSICLNKCDNVYVTISPTNSLQLTGVRSFCGSKCGNSGSSCCSSSCGSSCCH